MVAGGGEGTGEGGNSLIDFKVLSRILLDIQHPSKPLSLEKKRLKGTFSLPIYSRLRPYPNHFSDHVRYF